jgi:translation initiation factor 2B subunit (eIF-2B alpha/beta/delta family)
MTNADRLFDLIALLMEMADSVDECIGQLDEVRNLLASRDSVAAVTVLGNVRSVVEIITKASRDAAASFGYVESRPNFDGDGVARSLESCAVALETAQRRVVARERLAALARLDVVSDVLHVVSTTCRDAARAVR